MLNIIFLFACDTTFAFTYMIMKVVKDPKFDFKIFFFHTASSTYSPNIKEPLQIPLNSELKNNGHLSLLLFLSFNLDIMGENERTNLSPLFLFEECPLQKGKV